MNNMATIDTCRQGVIGLLLSFCIIAVWLVMHIWAVFFLAPAHLLVTLLIIALLTWLSVGLFIIAHDAMHGSLYPTNRKIGHLVGSIALMLYAGFSMSALLPKHHAHHRHSGSALDPDFSSSSPRSALAWYTQFMKSYFGWREFFIMVLRTGLYLLLGAKAEHIILFFAIPGLLSSFQLFYFGTFLPHRRAHAPFSDHHNARSNQFGYFTSLFTCFHFGYHHEHHLYPAIPWWRLPTFRHHMINDDEPITEGNWLRNRRI